MINIKNDLSLYGTIHYGNMYKKIQNTEIEIPKLSYYCNLTLNSEYEDGGSGIISTFVFAKPKWDKSFYDTFLSTMVNYSMSDNFLNLNLDYLELTHEKTVKWSMIPNLHISYDPISNCDILPKNKCNDNIIKFMRVEYKDPNYLLQHFCVMGIETSKSIMMIHHERVDFEKCV